MHGFVRIVFTPIILATVLAGCAIPNDKAAPDRVSLLGNTLAVTFSNGLRCQADNIGGSVSGRLSECPIPAQYDIKLLKSDYFGSHVTEPYADIIITMPDGHQRLFKTPKSRNWTGRDTFYKSGGYPVPTPR